MYRFLFDSPLSLFPGCTCTFSVFCVRRGGFVCDWFVRGDYRCAPVEDALGMFSVFRGARGRTGSPKTERYSAPPPKKKNKNTKLGPTL